MSNNIKVDKQISVEGNGCSSILVPSKDYKLATLKGILSLCQSMDKLTERVVSVNLAYKLYEPANSDWEVGDSHLNYFPLNYNPVFGIRGANDDVYVTQFLGNKHHVMDFVYSEPINISELIRLWGAKHG